MVRNIRQSKILEIISSKEIETQEELAKELTYANFKITQATISRDIKELGLIKVLSSTGKYKYAFIDGSTQTISPKFVNILREIIISIKQAQNLVVVKTIKGAGSICASAIDKIALNNILGITYGDDCAFIASQNNGDASLITADLSKIMER